MPTLHAAYDPADALARRVKSFATCGYYRREVIYLVVPFCALPHPQYSWPAFIADRTPYGVIQHELGHHIDQVFTGLDVYRARPGQFFSDKVRAHSAEKAITGYCPNTMEWFAEIFRLFVTNPDLLRRLRPRAYEALMDAGLKQRAECRPYAQVLKSFEAPPQVFQRAAKWLGQPLNADYRR